VLDGKAKEQEEIALVDDAIVEVPVYSLVKNAL
jgi:hypothetical protein